MFPESPSGSGPALNPFLPGAGQGLPPPPSGHLPGASGVPWPRAVAAEGQEEEGSFWGLPYRHLGALSPAPVLQGRPESDAPQLLALQAGLPPRGRSCPPGKCRLRSPAEVPGPRPGPWTPGGPRLRANPHRASDPQTPATQGRHRWSPLPRRAAATRVRGMREPPSPGEFPPQATGGSGQQQGGRGGLGMPCVCTGTQVTRPRALAPGEKPWRGARPGPQAQ